MMMLMQIASTQIAPTFWSSYGATIKKYWPSLAHVLAVSVIALNSGGRAAALAYPQSSVPIDFLWGIALHWAQSPRAK